MPEFSVITVQVDEIINRFCACFQDGVGYTHEDGLVVFLCGKNYHVLQLLTSPPACHWVFSNMCCRKGRYRCGVFACKGRGPMCALARSQTACIQTTSSCRAGYFTK